MCGNCVEKLTILSDAIVFSKFVFFETKNPILKNKNVKNVEKIIKLKKLTQTTDSCSSEIVP